MGRPSSFKQETADKICERIANGESLRSICSSEGMPAQAVVFRWLADEKFKLFREQYALARETQADTLADELLDIVDDGRNDWMERLGKDGDSLGWQVNGEAVQRSRLRADTRKWIASKLKPKKYGEKVEQQITGKDGGPVAVDMTLSIAFVGNDAD